MTRSTIYCGKWVLIQTRNKEKNYDNAGKSAENDGETLDLLRNKPINSTLTEHWFLLEEAWKEVEGLPQPLQFGKLLEYILEHASLPIKEHDQLLGRFIDKVPTEEEEARFQRIMQNNPGGNPITRMNFSHITLDWYNISKTDFPHTSPKPKTN